MFALQLFKDGKPHVVLIDDYILTEEEVPVTMEDSDLSVFLIEKARAKLIGSYYESFSAKQTSQQIFSELTGMNTDCQDIGSRSFNMIETAKK